MSPPPSSSRQRMKKSKQTEENYRKHRNPVSQSNSNSISGQKQLSVHFGPSQTHPSPSRSPSSNRRFGSSPNLRPRVSKSRQLNSYENQQHQQQHQQQQHHHQQQQHQQQQHHHHRQRIPPRRYGSLPRVGHSRSMVDFRRRSHAAAGEYRYVCVITTGKLDLA